MKRTIITSGSAYVDIDALACSVALADLLNTQGGCAFAVLTPLYNETIPSSVKNLEFMIQRQALDVRADDDFILVDVSEPQFFEHFVNQNKIVSIYDHHFGFESYWNERLGAHSHIEHVGSCATIIWEEIQRADTKEHMKKESLLLLYTAIIANTLNLRAKLTTDRDVKAEGELRNFLQPPEQWISSYYKEIETNVLVDVKAAILKDVKLQLINGYFWSIGQIELWDGRLFVNTLSTQEIIAGLEADKSVEHVLLIVSSISEGCNYIYSYREESQNVLVQVFDGIFQDNILITDRLWMRKEILRSLKHLPSLMSFSPGGGCGCKISQQVLDGIIQDTKLQEHTNLIVGNSTKDDAAVYRLETNVNFVFTTDFFTPITNKPFDFGRIAAANAISDVYAMGGSPMLALAILGWPDDVLSINLAREVMRGAMHTCRLANIVLAGGHSVRIATPLFGLAVTGTVQDQQLKRNDQATSSCFIFITKPIGVGILSTAEKKGLIKHHHREVMIDTMATLNNFGTIASHLDSVKAMTDVTGFGLLGHLLEICKGSNIAARLYHKKIPVFDFIADYIGKCTPSGTERNWQSIKDDVQLVDQSIRDIVCDPQTNGGLLIAVEKSGVQALKKEAKRHNVDLCCIGLFNEKDLSSPWIEVV